jgi:hypothetical protein
MSKTRCDLRVLVRFDDGTIGAYAINAIPSAARLRGELDCAGQVFSDAEVGEDLQPAEECHPVMRDIFDVCQNWLTAAVTPTTGGPA